jgi:protein TonB
MFDSLLQRKRLPERRLGTGAALSVAGHAVLLAVVLLVPREHGEEAAEGVSVTFFAEPAPRAGGPIGTPALPPAPPAAQSEPAAARPPRAPKPNPAAPRTIAEKTASRAPEAEDAPAPAAEAAKSEAPKTEASTGSGTTPGSQTSGGTGASSGGGSVGPAGGGAHGTPGGTATVTRAMTTEILPFGAGMTRPVQISGRDPAYTREALLAKVSGTMIVKCVITTVGTIKDCHLIKGLPHMERAVLDAMASRRYTPVTYQGRPVSVFYVFNIKLVLPGG